MLYNTSLHDRLIDRNCKTYLLDSIQPFGGIRIPHVDVLDFDRYDTMETFLDSMDQELHPVSNHENMDICIYDVLQCDNEYTIIIHGCPFLS